MQERIDNLYDILSFCKEEGITPVLITTPYTAVYDDLFSDAYKKEFRNTVSAIAGATGCSYYDYSKDDRFADRLEYFSDADHLNQEGALAFMNTIAEDIPEFKEFLSNTEPVHKGDPDWETPF